MIKINEITPENILAENLKKEIPELYALKKIVENDEFHDNEDVFTHTLDVLDKLEKVIQENNAERYLSERIEEHTKKELLIIATLLHDIAKPETIKHFGEETSCPGHEKKATEKSLSIIGKFSLTEKEKSIVLEIIQFHGEIHRIYDPPNENAEYEVEMLKKEHKTVFSELMILGIADFIGSQLEKKDKKDYEFRMKKYSEALDSFIQELF